MAMPMLALMRTLTPLRMNGCSSSAVRRLASPAAYAGSVSMSTAPSSSPPIRTSTSVVRSELISRGPSCLSSSSPAECPKESLISLKWSRSTKRKARCRGRCRGSAKSSKYASSRLVSWRRLPSPVSSSVTAWRWRSSVSARRPRTDRPRRRPTTTRVAVARPTATWITWMLQRAEEEDHEPGEGAGIPGAGSPGSLPPSRRSRRPGGHPDRDRHQGDGDRPGDPVEDDSDLFGRRRRG